MNSKPEAEIGLCKIQLDNYATYFIYHTVCFAQLIHNIFKYGH